MAFTKLVSYDGLVNLSIESHAYAYPDSENIYGAAWDQNWVGLHTPDHCITFDDITIERGAVCKRFFE